MFVFLTRVSLAFAVLKMSRLLLLHIECWCHWYLWFYCKIAGSWRKILLYLEYSSLCPSPWDVLCYVENFCVASLAKAALILIVAYLFLFFIYIKSHENQMETNYHISISCLNFPVDIFLRIDNDWTSHRPTEPEVQSHCQKYQKDGNCNTERLLSLKELYCSRSQGHVWNCHQIP